MLSLTVLALLADFLVFVIDFFWKFESGSAMSETLWCHMIMLQMELVKLSLILELVMNLFQRLLNIILLWIALYACAYLAWRF